MNALADLFTGTEFAPPAALLDGPAGFGGRGQAGYAALRARIADSGRFCAWRGLTGRRYMASIYGFDDCPDYENVVALAVRRNPDGRRAILAGVDLGAFPIIALNDAAMRAAREQGANEIHLHLLADTPEARAAAIEDLL